MPRNGHWFAIAGLLCTLLATLLSPTAASAADDSEGLALTFPQNDQPASTPAWTVSVEGIALGRLGGGVNRTLATRVTGTTPFLATLIAPGTEAFNSNQFQQGFSAGPKVGVIYRGDSGYGVDLSYFNVFNQSGTNSTGPDNPADWLVMHAPGGFWQTQDFPYQAMSWRDSTSLYSAEANVRLELSDRVRVLAGFRWLQLNDNLQGTLTPADRTLPTWKTICPLCDLFQVTPDGASGILPPFWTTGTANNLYGAQVGVDGTILEFGSFSVDGRITIGLFDNHATQSTGVSIEKIVHPTTATANQAAFVSDAGVTLKYRVMPGLSLKAGYELLWLVGVALAPGQIEETYAARSDVRALGINRGSSVLFQGATFGLEYSF